MNYAEPGFPAFALIEPLPGRDPAGYLTQDKADGVIAPDLVSQDGSSIHISFPSISFTVKAETRPDHIRLTLTGVEPEGADFGCLLFGGAKQSGEPRGKNILLDIRSKKDYNRVEKWNARRLLRRDETNLQMERRCRGASGGAIW